MAEEKDRDSSDFAEQPGLTEGPSAPRVAIDRALPWLERWWKEPRECPVCHHTNWEVGEVVEVRVFAGGDLILGGRIYPLIPVTCTTCGNTLFFNAVQMGVVKPDEAAPPDEAGT